MAIGPTCGGIVRRYSSDVTYLRLAYPQSLQITTAPFAITFHSANAEPVGTDARLVLSRLVFPQEILYKRTVELWFDYMSHGLE